MRAITAALVGLAFAAAAPAGAQEAPSPYRDQQFTEIRGLTDAELAELRSGHGMGLARAAELNGYPGPRHVLDAVAAGQLQASPDQIRRIEQIFADMAGTARRLGEQIVAEERELERAFRVGTIDATGVGSRVTRIASLRGELRAVHLTAHVATRAVLSPAQIARYNELRGYRASPEQPAHKGH